MSECAIASLADGVLGNQPGAPGVGEETPLVAVVQAGAYLRPPARVTAARAGGMPQGYGAYCGS